MRKRCPKIANVLTEGGGQVCGVMGRDNLCEGPVDGLEPGRRRGRSRGADRVQQGLHRGQAHMIFEVCTHQIDQLSGCFWFPRGQDWEIDAAQEQLGYSFSTPGSSCKCSCGWCMTA